MFYDETADINAMTLQKGTGNIGIGTTSPTQKLTVAGNVDTQSGYGYLTEIANDATTGTTSNKLAKLTTSGAAVFGVATTVPATARTRTAAAARIFSFMTQSGWGRCRRERQRMRGDCA